jgi:hypothetical protein
MADTTETGLATEASAPADQYADFRKAAPWLEKVTESVEAFAEWNTKCDSIDKQYADLKRLSGANGERQMQMFWANLEVLKPSIYARPPVPVVQGRFKNQRKGAELIRHGSEVLERSLNTSFDMEDLHESLKGVRDDLATNARGQIWVKFEEDEEGGNQRICYEHLSRKDFLHEWARKWKEVGWVGKRTYLTSEKLKRRFPNVDTTKIKFSTKKDEKSGETHSKVKKACVIEIWSKTDNVVVWVTEGPDDVLDIQPPFLKIEKFFPCPRPAYGTIERESLNPVPDFVFYKDQIEEINEFTARISALAESLRLKGFYAAGGEDVASAIEAAIKKTDNNALLIPVPSVAAFGAGLKDAIIWMPVDQVVGVIKTLIELRRQMIEDVYQITGLSDIMRGASDPNETLGAQQLKSQYGSVRIRDRQEELIRIARDVARISGEIMAENFSPESLMVYSQYEGAPSQAEVQQQIMQIDQQIAQAKANPQIMQQAQQNPEMAQQMLAQADQQKQELSQTVTMEQVFEFLRNERLRPFALDIETDSTIQADEDTAKQRTTEFLTAMGTALAQLSPMVQQQPQTAEFAGEVLKFAVAPFRAGRQLEASIDTFIEQMKGATQEPKADPVAEKAKADAEVKAQEMQAKQEEARLKAETQANEMGMRVEELRATLETERQQAIAAQQQSAADLEKTRAEIDKIHAEIERINKQAGAAVITASAKAAQSRPEFMNNG